MHSSHTKADKHKPMLTIESPNDRTLNHGTKDCSTVTLESKMFRRNKGPDEPAAVFARCRERDWNGARRVLLKLDWESEELLRKPLLSDEENGWSIYHYVCRTVLDVVRLVHGTREKRRLKRLFNE